MNSKIFSITGIGDIEVCKHHNSKRLAIKLKPGNIPKVVIPNLMTYKMGYRFAFEKKQWIIQHSKQLNESAHTTIYDQNSTLKTQHHTISIKLHDKNLIKAVKSDNEVNILIPEKENIELQKNQDAIKNIIIEIFRFEAKQKLIPRIEELANSYGFKYNKVYIKNLKSRWGSCSIQNNINLNLHLVRLPEYLSDFIILHELCHTIHKNHGTQFHELLNKIVGNEKILNKELKNYTTQL